MKNIFKARRIYEAGMRKGMELATKRLLEEEISRLEAAHARLKFESDRLDVFVPHKEINNEN